MSSQPSATPGWYPDPERPGTERFWDGNEWGQIRPAGAAAPPPGPAAPGKANRGCFKTGLLIVGGLFGALIVLTIVVGVLGTAEDDEATTEAVAELDTDEPVDEDDGTSAEAADVEADEPEADTQELEGLPGEDDGPYPFGQLHSRDKGFNGAGWDISIDNVEAGSPGPFADDNKECTVVTGTATLREYTGDGLASNPFAFPTITVLDTNGQGADKSFGACDTDALEADGYVRAIDVSLSEGASVQWFEVFLTEEAGVYNVVAIEETIYEP